MAARVRQMGTAGAVLRIAPDGSFSFLTADDRLGWRSLLPAAVANGILSHAQPAGVEETAGDRPGLVLLYEYSPSGLRERMTLRLIEPAALALDRELHNPTDQPVDLREALLLPAGPDGGIVFGSHSPASLRCIHVSHLRETARRSSHATGPFVSPLPWQVRTLGDSEGHPFPALAIADGATRTFLLEAALQQDVFTQMWRVQADDAWEPARPVLGDYAAIARDGRSQPIALGPGETRRLFALYYQILPEAELQTIYDGYLAELNRRYDLKGKTSPFLDCAVYCTWNYTFFADISESIVRRQCAFLAAHLPEVRYFLIDDGYQLSTNTPSYDFGKWYPDPNANVDPVRFPGGMRAAAETIRSYGLQPAIWWAPAMTHHNRLAAEHPEWLCLNDRGELWSMDSGPARKAALDFSLPDVREFVEHCLDVIFGEWGYVGMKLDFCTYPFDCKDIRFRRGQGVHWWNWLCERIARRIPRGGFFQVCGSAPYGNPFVARWADSHRVGGDIGRGQWHQHVGISRAPLPLLGVPGRATWLMDVDSAGIRHDLSDDENLSRLHFCFITQGVLGLGGNLAQLSDRHVAWLQRITRNVDRGHRVYCPDRRAFVGDPLPEALFVDYPAGSRTARAGVRKHVALFNWTDEPRTFGYSLHCLGIGPGDPIRDFWTHEAVPPQDEQVVASLRPRASRLLEVVAG